MDNTEDPSSVLQIILVSCVKYLLPDSLEPSGLVQLLSTDYKFAVSFSILVIVLLVRPSGIFKGKTL